MSHPSKLLTAAQVGEIFGVSGPQVHHWRKRHGWPHIKVGTTYRFRLEDVEAILQKHLVNPDGLNARPKRTMPPRRRS